MSVKSEQLIVIVDTCLEKNGILSYFLLCCMYHKSMYVVSFLFWYNSESILVFTMLTNLHVKYNVFQIEAESFMESYFFSWIFFQKLYMLRLKNSWRIKRVSRYLHENIKVSSGKRLGPYVSCWLLKNGDKKKSDKLGGLWPPTTNTSWWYPKLFKKLFHFFVSLKEIISLYLEANRF